LEADARKCLQRPRLGNLCSDTQISGNLALGLADEGLDRIIFLLGTRFSNDSDQAPSGRFNCSNRHGNPHGSPVRRIHPRMVGNREGQRQRIFRLQLRLEYPAVEGLLDTIGGDKAEALGLAGTYSLGGDMPPVHDEIRRIRHLRPGAAHRIHIAVAHCGTHALVPHERRIPNDVIRLRPLGLARVDVAVLLDLSRLVGDLLAGDRTDLLGQSIPAGQRLAGLVGNQLHRVIGDQRIAVLDVVEVAQYRLWRVDLTVGAEVPLQVADPQHHLGDLRRTRVDLHAEELVRVDGQALQLEGAGFDQAAEHLQHLAFQALHVLQGDVEEVTAAAGRIEHAGLAQLVVELADLGHRLLGLALLPVGQRGGLYLRPFGAQRLDDGRQHQAFDVGARRVVGAEFVPLARVQGALQQGAEDRRLDVTPVGLGRLDQQFNLLGVQRDGGRIGE